MKKVCRYSINIMYFIVISFYCLIKMFEIRFPNKTLSALRYDVDVESLKLGPVIIALILRSIVVGFLILVLMSFLLKAIKRWSIQIKINILKLNVEIIIKNIYSKIEFVVVIIIAVLSFFILQDRIQLDDYLKCRYEINKRIEKISRYSPVINGSRLVAHGGGGIDGHTYTNSIEAIRFNYDSGHRAFEIDFNLMRDGIILCAHDIEHLNSITAVTDTLVSTKDYYNHKIYGKYTVTSLEVLFDFMSKNPNMYLVTDSKLAQSSGIEGITNEEYNARFWREFVKVAKNIDPFVLDRVVPQLYYPEMLAEIECVFPFRRYILTLYATSMDANAVVHFAYEHPEVSAVTMWPARLDEPGMVSGLRAIGVPIYVHTINSEKEAELFIYKGAYGIYTDFLLPGQVENAYR